MALVDVDSWSVEYAACERLSHKLRTQLNQRDTVPRGSNDYTRHTAALEAGLQQFTAELKQLHSKVAGVGNAGQLQERRKQHGKLEEQLQRLKARFNNTPQDDDRATLFGMTNERSSSRTAKPTARETPTDDAVGGDGVEALKKRQIAILEEQNRGLETLSQTISRQRQMATQLGREVEDQHEILDDMVTTIERVDAGVNSETANISRITQRESTWGYWLVIGSLFVAIVLVIVL